MDVCSWEKILVMLFYKVKRAIDEPLPTIGIHMYRLVIKLIKSAAAVARLQTTSAELLVLRLCKVTRQAHDGTGF